MSFGERRAGIGKEALTLAVTGAALISAPDIASAADHLDTPAAIADPAADIGDLFAWMSPDGRRLNLVMAIVAHRFSDGLQYVFHVDSGAQFGTTTSTATLTCRFDFAGVAECRAGDTDQVRGPAGDPAGLTGRNGRFRVFAGLRDDPFFNNVKGSRAALDFAAAALRAGAPSDDAGCPRFDAGTSRQIFDRWQRTGEGPGTNFLAGWTPASLVISVDVEVVSTGGKQLAVWGAIHEAASGLQVERMGRALTANALLGLFAADGVGARLKEEYNRAAQAEWPRFTDEIARGLALYDGFDGNCGNQWLADRAGEPTARYSRLARLLTDDRLWIDATATACTQYLGVELAAGPGEARGDCGGRTPNYDAVDVFRSLLATGARAGLADGVDRDEQTHSISVFPYLAAPVAASVRTTDAAATEPAAAIARGAIAVANLDSQIARLGDDPEAVQFLLARARFLGDHEALNRAAVLAENLDSTPADLLRRAQARSAVHRFAQALADIRAAEAAGAGEEATVAQRLAVCVSIGRAAECVQPLEAATRRSPTYASLSTLAGAYAELGRFDAAERTYLAALAALSSTSPFPHAWIHFARGRMWAEQAGDAARADAAYRQALEYLPQFVAAQLHLAEIEVARGNLTAATSRLERMSSSTEPEVLALRGEVHLRSGDETRGRQEIARARERFEELLAGQAFAFADHAAEFYLGPGGDAERAWQLSRQNLAARRTPAALALMARAERATGRVQSEAEVVR